MRRSVKPVILVILDGVGHAPPNAYNAVYHAHMPHFKEWLKKYPNTLLQASGTAVGLFENQASNSQVGHLTIGAGRTIEQDIVRFTTYSNEGYLAHNSMLKNLLEKLPRTASLHIMGLLSDGKVHSDSNHALAFLDIFGQTQKKNAVYVHAFLDGRDVAPQSARTYLTAAEKHLALLPNGAIGSLHGRFYAMDRDHNWLRTQSTYEVLTQPQELLFDSWQRALDHYYAQHISDEFIPPTCVHPHSFIKDGDGVIFFNIRADRAQQLNAAFLDTHFTKFSRKPLALSFFLTPVDYSYKHEKYIPLCVLPKVTVTDTLKEVLATQGKTIVSIAETEKYAHVTYFFNGNNAVPFPGETQIFIPSAPEKSYVDRPEMAAQDITQTALHSLTHDPHDFYLINYANGDMVGHSGNFTATVKALEVLDHQLALLANKVLAMNGTLFITGDHGKAECLKAPLHHQQETAHTNNPVYFLMLSQEPYNEKLSTHLHSLADIAPFILSYMNIPVPPQMKRDY